MILKQDNQVRELIDQEGRAIRLPLDYHYRRHFMEQEVLAIRLPLKYQCQI